MYTNAETRHQQQSKKLQFQQSYPSFLSLLVLLLAAFITLTVRTKSAKGGKNQSAIGTPKNFNSLIFFTSISSQSHYATHPK